MKSQKLETALETANDGLQLIKKSRAREMRLLCEGVVVSRVHVDVMKALANNRSITSLDLGQCEVRMTVQCHCVPEFL
jgi:hypothetical protein